MNRPAIRSMFLIISGLSVPTACVGNQDALWQIVSGKCLPAAQAGDAHNPCAKVDLKGGFVVFKDSEGIAQYLLIPTTRITGIESPDLTRADTPNYWRAAWDARSYVDQALNVELHREDVGLAINSRGGRSQNQLHIHIDCMQPAVEETLKALMMEPGALTEQWRDLPTSLHSHRYRARVITDATLTATDPFKLLAADIEGRGESMADQTLLLTGTTLPNGDAGFIVLNDHVHGLDRASSEELLDHECAVREHPTRGSSG
jgi:CDP-diacylglycerol pyrophosphatase